MLSGGDGVSADKQAAQEDTAKDADEVANVHRHDCQHAMSPLAKERNT